MLFRSKEVKVKDLMENNLPESINRLKFSNDEEGLHIEEPDDLEREIDFSHNAKQIRRQQIQDFIVSDDEIDNL